jgi:hypothetical protein
VSGYLDDYFEAVRRALELGLADKQALCAELAAMLDDDELKRRFAELWRKYVSGVELPYSEPERARG